MLNISLATASKRLRNSFRSRALQNQRGVALVLAITMLAIISLLGVMALSGSNTELGISANYRSSQQAFFAAQRAVEYAMTNGVIYDRPTTDFPVNLVDDGDTSTVTENDHFTNINAGLSNSGLKSGAANQVDFLRSGALPPGTGSDPTYFQARYYVVTATGAGPHNSEMRVESQISRIVPK